MTTFDERFSEQAIPLLVQQFGGAASYLPPPGTPTRLAVSLTNAIVKPERREKRTSDLGIAIVVTREVQLVTDSSHDDYCGVEDPRRNAVITVGALEYVVENVTVKNAHGLQVLKCMRHELASVTREKHWRGS